jgi:hypothetical protein
MQMPRNDLPPHMVIEEVEKGYMLNDKVIRHAKVVVSSVPLEEQSGAEQSESSTGALHRSKQKWRKEIFMKCWE